MDILTLIRDQAWQFAGVVATAVFGIVAIVVSVILYLRQNPKKGLSFQYIVNTALVGIGRAKGIEDRIKITFDDVPVSSLHLVQIRLTNTGNTPIVPTDYIRPIAVCMTSEGRMISAAIEETEPDNLGAAISLDRETNQISLAPILLNKGDSITIQLLADSVDSTYRVDGRIVGVKDFQPRPPNLTRAERVEMLGYALGIILCLVMTTYFIYHSELMMAALVVMGAGIFVGMLSEMISAHLRWAKTK